MCTGARVASLGEPCPTTVEPPVQPLHLLTVDGGPAVPQSGVLLREGEGLSSRLGEFGGDAPGSVPWTLLPSIPMTEGQFACRTESFCGVLGVVDVPAADAGAFLEQAVPYCNDQVWGNLSCSVMIHPKTRRSFPEVCDRAIGDLRYGTVAVNAWGGAGAALMVSKLGKPWLKSWPIIARTWATRLLPWCSGVISNSWYGAVRRNSAR